MWIVKGEEYICDYNRKPFVKTFTSLSAIEEWLFGMMQWSYADHMCFPNKKSERNFPPERLPYTIEINPSPRGANVWIYMISSSNGIEFSSGKLTEGQRHWSERMKSWLNHCEERKTAPKFNFAK